MCFFTHRPCLMLLAHLPANVWRVLNELWEMFANIYWHGVYRGSIYARYVCVLFYHHEIHSRTFWKRLIHFIPCLVSGVASFSEINNIIKFRSYASTGCRINSCGGNSHVWFEFINPKGLSGQNTIWRWYFFWKSWHVRLYIV